MQKSALAVLLTLASDQGAVPSSRSQYLRIHLPGLSTCVCLIFPCLSTCVCVISMPQCMRMNFHVLVPTYIILSFILSLQNSVITFVLRGCDSISLVPYVPGPILATICT